MKTRLVRWLKDLVSRWPVVAAALIAAGIVHICTVLAMPQIYRNDAVTRLSRTLPANELVILPAAKAGGQVLPYQLPDTRVGLCRFDLRDGPLAVRAVLPEPGWMLSGYAPGGQSFYTMPASETRRLTINLLVLPVGERFIGTANEARLLDQDTSQVIAPGRTGLIVIQAPLKGRTYASELEQAMGQASCRGLRF
jgi:uncharacterized membrane protein